MLPIVGHLVDEPGAIGPAVDPRTGEIINSEITWFHNHMRSYRNRLLLETGAANPAARTLDIPEDLMGETMRQVITHEIGHALGLQHNMVASSSFPVEKLRDPKFTSQYGVSATIMDYARQNYVAQPGDGLQPKDFIRRLGPFDDFAINWGYRVIPDARTADAEKPTLNRWLTSQTGPFPYRYVSQGLGSADPRNQTEDLGDDPAGLRHLLDLGEGPVPTDPRPRLRVAGRTGEVARVDDFDEREAGGEFFLHAERVSGPEGTFKFLDKEISGLRSDAASQFASLPMTKALSTRLLAQILGALNESA